MASSPPPPSDTTAGAPSSSTAVPRDTGKAPAVEATILGGVSSTCILCSARRMPAVGGGSSQPTPPNTEFEIPSDVGSGALPSFDATTYTPLVHIIGGGGSLRYRPPLCDASAEILHKDPEQHFGFTNRKANEKLRMLGSGPQVFEWYERLPQSARDAVALAGFERLILGFRLPKAELGLTTALVERWWDTTNTFHLLEAGEMTITPGDFALLTGLRVGGDPLPIDPRIHERRGAFDYLLGKTPTVSESSHITYTWLREQFDHTGILTEVSLPQLVWAFLLYLLGQTLFCNKENSVHVQFLAALVDLETIAEFDWGTPALATLYGHLSACSRGVSLSLGGHHRVLELWAFEHLLQFPPPTDHREPRFVPRAARWLKGIRKKRSPAMDLPAWRRVLDHLTVDQVRFDPWGTLLDDAPLELTSARALDSQHFLLEGPFSRAWYLGERVASQYFPRSEALQFVPLPPPAGMRSTHLLTGEGLLLALERRLAVDFLREGDYSAFRLASLTLPTATTDVAAATPVWPRAPSFISFHNANREEERLPLTPCASQLYVLPAGVPQVPADIVQEWLRAFQSAEASVRRQRSRIVASAGVSEGGSTRAGDRAAGAGDGDADDGGARADARAGLLISSFFLTSCAQEGPWAIAFFFSLYL
ncbi:hypothetical protein RHMOL_Rhmol01G0203200 [Rhododendron molle]|uniref:Uncharacterized protein n=1 Tax=Rhododendron molle TaxID=49168 RepID=A0ACC0Q545_RHOML|nr:hypothetical protein RHMOL_Rhmol01G0203200 [Rhododendron molle]